MTVTTSGGVTTFLTRAPPPHSPRRADSRSPIESQALLGANGAGKSTLLSPLGAYQHPTSGQVDVLGHRLGRVDVLPAASIAEVARLVRLTATHDPAEGDRDGAVLCDADLAILAAVPDRYAAYAGAVREEYAAVPEEAFRAGRADVLRRLLASPSLFRTAAARERWEAAARHNVETELTLLASGGAGPLG